MPQLLQLYQAKPEKPSTQWGLPHERQKFRNLSLPHFLHECALAGSQSQGQMIVTVLGSLIPIYRTQVVLTDFKLQCGPALSVGVTWRINQRMDDTFSLSLPLCLPKKEKKKDFLKIIVCFLFSNYSISNCLILGAD